MYDFFDYTDEILCEVISETPKDTPKTSQINNNDSNSTNMDNTQKDIFENSEELSSQLMSILPEHNVDPSRSNQNDSMNKNKSRKDTYRKSDHFHKIQNYPHYNQKYDKCEIYIMLKLLFNNNINQLKPPIKVIKDIRIKYNQYCLIILKNGQNNQQMPIFKSDYAQRMDLAIWFMEDHKEIFKPFLRKCYFN